MVSNSPSNDPQWFSSIDFGNNVDNPILVKIFSSNSIPISLLKNTIFWPSNLFGLFNIDGKDLKQVELDSSNNNFDEKLSVQNDAQEIDVTIVPSSNNSRKRKKSKPKRSKKILNEEFDLEEDDFTDTNSKPNANKGLKQKKRYHHKKPKTKTSLGEVNYNSEEYHKKQHKF